MNAKDFTNREKEIREAKAKYPGMEIGAAYKLYKEEKGEEPKKLFTSDVTLPEIKKKLKEMCLKPCTQNGCEGRMKLEPVCEGCVEGKAGYKSKWTCNKCLFRELSKQKYTVWMEQFSESLSSRE